MGFELQNTHTTHVLEFNFPYELYIYIFVSIFNKLNYYTLFMQDVKINTIILCLLPMPMAKEF